MMRTEHHTAGEYDRTMTYVQKNSYPALREDFSPKHIQRKHRGAAFTLELS